MHGGVPQNVLTPVAAVQRGSFEDDGAGHGVRRMVGRRFDRFAASGVSMLGEEYTPVSDSLVPVHRRAQV